MEMGYQRIVDKINGCGMKYGGYTKQEERMHENSVEDVRSDAHIDCVETKYYSCMELKNE